jgi:perosamine synthetase
VHLGEHEAILMRRLGIKTVIDIVRSMREPFYDFVQGHGYLSTDVVSQGKEFVGVDSPAIVLESEDSFSRLVGDGGAVSYAAVRMGFFDLMRCIGIGAGDEVILFGATCAVMPNSVLRTGATAVFSDIDPQTFGSSVHGLAKCITARTKMIVAQHSFGIPSDIAPIVELARNAKIFLLEDCALTLGSTVGGIPVGNFGDAALFSSDHARPLSTLFGGLVYTRNLSLLSLLRESRAALAELPLPKQHALWRRFLLERYYCVPARYARIGLVELFGAVMTKLFRWSEPFLSDDFSANPGTAYPYPAKLPAFLAFLGLLEVKRWPEFSSNRKIFFRKFMQSAEDSPFAAHLPLSYRNKKNIDIVPLRLAWAQPDSERLRKSMADFIHVAWTWFMRPIIATNLPLDGFGYQAGSCPISKSIGPGMVNLPCIGSAEDADRLFNYTIRKTVPR